MADAGKLCKENGSEDEVPEDEVPDKSIRNQIATGVLRKDNDGRSALQGLIKMLSTEGEGFTSALYLLSEMAAHSPSVASQMISTIEPVCMLLVSEELKEETDINCAVKLLKHVLPHCK